MYFVKAEPHERKKGFKRTKLLALIEDFKNSDLDLARVEDWEYVSAKVGANAINAAIRNFKIGGVRAFTRKENIYLERTDV